MHMGHNPRDNKKDADKLANELCCCGSGRGAVGVAVHFVSCCPELGWGRLVDKKRWMRVLGGGKGLCRALGMQTVVG
jgi:hypothetical protein